MEWNWEDFEQGPVESNTERIHVTINRRGNLFLNRNAVEAMGEPDAVKLMYDRRRSTIGVVRAPLAEARRVPSETKGAETRRRANALCGKLLQVLLDLPRRDTRLSCRRGE